MSYIDGDKPPRETSSIQETGHSEGQSKSKSENSGMSIMEINDLLDIEDREEKVRLWKASLEDFKADMEKWQRGAILATRPYRQCAVGEPGSRRDRGLCLRLR